MQRDMNRSRFVKVEAEFQVTGKTPTLSFSELCHFKDNVVKRSWFKNQVGVIQVELSIDDDRFYMNDACIPRMYSTPFVIRVARAQLTKLAVLHSLAHILHPSQGIAHDMDFVKSYLELVRRYHNGHIDEAFKKEFKQALMKQGVKTKIVSDATKEKQRAAWIKRSVPTRQELIDSIRELEEM